MIAFALGEKDNWWINYVLVLTTFCFQFLNSNRRKKVAWHGMTLHGLIYVTQEPCCWMVRSDEEIILYKIQNWSGTKFKCCKNQWQQTKVYAIKSALTCILFKPIFTGKENWKMTNVILTFSLYFSIYLIVRKYVCPVLFVAWTMDSGQ